jgi:hypothetical protein
MPSPLVPIVGREAELKAVALALHATTGGSARVVSLVGDAGVGKSRLIEEGTALAGTRGFLVLHSVASPLHADLHYGVVVEALRPVVRSVEAGARTRLVEGLPDLGRLFDGLDLPPPPPLDDAGMERTRLFDAVCRLLDRLTRQQPVLLAVDDRVALEFGRLLAERGHLELRDDVFFLAWTRCARHYEMAPTNSSWSFAASVSALGCWRTPVPPRMARTRGRRRRSLRYRPRRGWRTKASCGRSTASSVPKLGHSAVRTVRSPGSLLRRVATPVRCG